jgi:hypothetical protein
MDAAFAGQLDRGREAFAEIGVLLLDSGGDGFEVDASRQRQDHAENAKPQSPTQARRTRCGPPRGG